MPLWHEIRIGGSWEADDMEASPYSYIGFSYLRKQRKLLEQYDIELEFFPYFLGGVNHATGNQSPFFNKAKAAYGPFDFKRASAFFKLPAISAPPFFPMVSLLPQRAICAVKALHPRDKFETVYDEFWPAVYNRHVDISNPANLRDVLRLHLTDGEVDHVMELATQAKYKGILVANTKTAIDSGAFGAPWFILENFETGEREPVFGSDRWAYLFRFLGVDIQELSIVDKVEGKARL